MPKEEHLNIIKQGADKWNKWRANNPNIQPDLSGADLRGEVLAGANLSNALLRDAKLVRTGLNNANLHGANLNKARLRWAKLSGADLIEAELPFASLVETDLNNARLEKADLRKADLSKATLHSANLNEANLEGANFSHADLRGSKLNYANLTGAHLANTILLKAKLTHANLNKAELSKAQLAGADLSYAELGGTNISGASLYEADLRNATFTGANLDGADFTRAIADEDQFAPNQLSNKQREQLQFSIEITVKETEKTEEKQDKYGDGPYGEAVYGGKGDREGGGQIPDGEDKDWLQQAFLRFLETEKGYPRDSIQLGKNRVDPVSSAVMDMALIVPKTGETAGVIEFTYRNDQKSLADAMFQVERYRQSLNQPNIPAYIVCPSLDKSSEPFEICKVSDNGYESILINDFPKYEDLIRRLEIKTEVSGGKGGDDDFEKVFRENLIAFLINEKKFPRESLNHGILAEVRDLDLTVTHPDTDSILAIFEFKSANYGINFPQLSEIMAKAHKKGFVGKYNPFVYIVHPSEESNEDFVILEVEDDGTSNEISYEDFPIYDQLLFASPLSNPGRRICWALTTLAKDKHGFSVHTPCQDYIDLQIKKNGRTAAQIHRVNHSDENIALVLAGYQRDFPEAKLTAYMFEGEVKQLSGYTSKSQGERNWLEGNLGHQELKYEAGVYILRPGSLVLDEIENEVGDLLDLAKNNAEGEKEPEAKKVSKYGRGGIATIQMDRLSDVDLLGREKLVRAFAGMFVHTEAVEGFTVALLGDWGEGKSTVMKLLRKSLNKKHPGRFDFATFNAWEYEHTDNIAAGLSQEVVKGLKSNLGLGRFHTISLAICFTIIENRWNLFKLVLCGIISSILYIHLDPLNFSFKGEMLLKESVGTGLLGLGGLSTLIYLIKTAKNIIGHPLPTNLEKYFKLPNYAKHLGLIPVLKRHITTLCKLKLNAIRIYKFKWGKDRKLVVFVDDLDRCQTDCIARSLDAIRLVMSIPNVIVMIGIDDRIAFKAMENYYEKLGDKGRDKSKIARDYLGKIIQLPVRLVPSSPEEVRKYIEKRLFPDAQRIEFIKKDADIDTERHVIEPSKPAKKIIEAKGEKVGVPIPDDKKVEEQKSVEEILKDTTVERDMFSDLAGRFNFSNPRQLLRLRNSYRFLKVMDSDEKCDREVLMKILFWHEFLNNWSPKIRCQCEKSVKEQESLAKIEKPEAKQIVQGVREDILKIIGMDMYDEIERFVRIVVLPHSEEGVLDTREEIEE